MFYKLNMASFCDGSFSVFQFLSPYFGIIHQLKTVIALTLVGYEMIVTNLAIPDHEEHMKTLVDC